MRLTGLVITTAIIGLGIYDLVALLVNGVGSTISQYLWSAGFKAPVMVFGFGFVSGHLFGNMNKK